MPQPTDDSDHNLELMQFAAEVKQRDVIERNAVVAHRKNVAELAKYTTENKATEFYDRLKFWVKDFEDSLDPNFDIAIQLVSFDETITFRVEKIGCYDPSLIVFHGTKNDGTPITLVQHVSQINFLLSAVKRQDPTQPRKLIGFQPPTTTNIKSK